MPTKDRFGLSAWIEESIRAFVKSSENKLHMNDSEPAWDMPVVGFSRGDDPIFPEIKAIDRRFLLDPPGRISADLS